MYTNLDHFFACMALEYRKSHTAKDATVSEEIQHLISSFTGFYNGANLTDLPLYLLEPAVDQGQYDGRGFRFGVAWQMRAMMSTGEGRMKAAWCARVADPSSIIPVDSLALRRFRTEVVEPLFNSSEFLKTLHDVVADVVIQDEGTIWKLLEICSNIGVEPSHPVLQRLRAVVEKVFRTPRTNGGHEDGPRRVSVIRSDEILSMKML
ncbi:hypothetical protein F5146DRAFT_213631 [Armillaria mellea]|nr:hypothetical protein F5146DRAFT_213631 [Armillaria mellea]